MPEWQVGMLKLYMADIAVNLWGRDLLQQWGAQINIPAISETAHKMMFKMGYVHGKEL